MHILRSSLRAGIATLLFSCLIANLAHATTSASLVTTDGQLLSGGQADGQIGDLILENDEIAVIISALGHVTHYGENGGTVIDAGLVGSRTDALGELYTYFDDDWPRQAVYNTLFILDDGGSGGPAVIRAEGHDLTDPTITVATEYSLAEGDQHLTLTTWVTGGDGIQPNFELGDCFAWGSGSKYAPGYGWEMNGTTTQAWIAGWSPDVCYAYGGTAGDCWGPNGSGWSDLNLTTETLLPDEAISYTRFMSVAWGEIAAAVAILYEAQGVPTGSLTCSVHNQADGSPLTGAQLDVFDGSDLPHLQMIVDGTGQAFASLPPGDWRVQASMTGFVPQESWLTVLAGGHDNLDFHLDPVPSGGEAIGDTLTVIQRPLVNIPALVLPGQTLEINCDADPTTTGWQAELSLGELTLPLPIDQAVYDPATEWWTLDAIIPTEVSLYELYDLRVMAAGELDDTTRDAVQILESYREDFYFVHITDTHLPTHYFSDSGGSPADSTEMVDLREVIADINVINPEFVLITGDYVNEGELEDYLEWRSYTRAQRMLYEFAVPTFLVSGNHDLGGWVNTPPPDGTARRNWWRFFGWRRLDDPPAGAPWFSQNYSFDYGPVHFVGMEAYVNYDLWRQDIYGTESFTSGQLEWLNQDLATAAGSQTQVLFYHKDFQNQVDLSALDVEMALWGHVHGDRGDLQTPPFDIATNNVSDGQRSYRLIRVNGSMLQPEPTLSAGGTGQNLRVVYSPSNAGLASTVAAEITNDQPQRFENGRLRFIMPSAGGNYSAVGGEIIQVDQSGAYDVCHVAVDVLASGAQTVTVSPTSTHVTEGDAPGRLHLAQNHPNPFNPRTRLEYYLPEAGTVQLSVHDLRGHEVVVLVDEVKNAGSHNTFWDGRDSGGRGVAAGTYFVRLATKVEKVSRKITLVR